jgi:magnesium chelatase subunit H
VNLANLVRLHINRYASGPRAALHNALTVGDPELYPDEGAVPPQPGRPWHLTSREALPARGAHGTVGLLVGRSYLLAGNTAHYDAVIAALEGQGLTVVPGLPRGSTPAPRSTGSSGTGRARRPSTRWSPSPASRWWAGRPTTTRPRRRRP